MAYIYVWPLLLSASVIHRHWSSRTMVLYSEIVVNKKGNVLYQVMTWCSGYFSVRVMQLCGSYNVQLKVTQWILILIGISWAGTGLPLNKNGTIKFKNNRAMESMALYSITEILHKFVIIQGSTHMKICAALNNNQLFNSWSSAIIERYVA